MPTKQMDMEKFRALLASCGALKALMEEEPQGTAFGGCAGRGTKDIPQTVRSPREQSDYMALAQTWSLGGIVCAILRAGRSGVKS